MGYLFLALALSAGCIKGFCGKKISNFTNTFHNAILANYLRMLLCTVVGLVIVFASGEISSLIPSAGMLLISALSGISTAVFVVSWLLCVKKSAYMMVDIFLMLGLLLPLTASNILFSEKIRISQWIGITILFAAVIIMYSYNNTIKAKITPTSLLLLFVCGLASGTADFSQKLFTKFIPGGSAAVFNFYTYVFAALVLLIAFILTRSKTNVTNKADLKKIFGFIVIMAVCLFANSYFKTQASRHLSAVLLYPLNQGLALVIGALMSSFFFKEKLNLKAIVGIATAFAGLITINLL